MAATAADLKIFAAKTMLDTNDGGGPRASALVQNGSSNVIFPDVSASDRIAGRVHLRKVYPSVVNNDLATLLGATAVQNAVPSDPAVSTVLFRYGSPLTTREQALVAFREGEHAAVEVSAATGGTATAASATATGFTIPNTTTFDASSALGYAIVGAQVTDVNAGPPSGYKYVLRRVVSRSGTNVTFDRAIPFSGTVAVSFVTQVVQDEAHLSYPKAYGSVAVTATVTSGTTALAFAHRLAQVAGVSETLALPVSTSGFGALASAVQGTSLSNGYRKCLGLVPVFRDGDAVTLWDEQTTTAASQASGSTVNVGRTNLDQIAVVSAAGVEVARFLANGPAPGVAGLAADLTTGIVTFSAGWTTATVTVRHRIAHRSAITAVGIGGATLAVPVTRDFPSGSIISSHVALGDLQARAYNMLAQQAWTRVWSDAVIGSSVAMMYSGTPVVTNKGGETDRWAIVFKTANTFDCYSEVLGLVASGDTATAFSPINPVTGVPFFTLASASWASTILVGSVLRFNTEGAGPPLWALRSVAPSSASGTQTMALRIHGSVDA